MEGPDPRLLNSIAAGEKDTPDPELLSTVDPEKRNRLKEVRPKRKFGPKPQMISEKIVHVKNVRTLEVSFLKTRGFCYLEFN